LPGSQNRIYRIRVLRSSINAAENKGKTRDELKDILLTQYKQAGKNNSSWNKHQNTRLSDINEALDDEEIQ
jgi:hypothetical protein